MDLKFISLIIHLNAISKFQNLTIIVLLTLLFLDSNNQMSYHDVVEPCFVCRCAFGMYNMTYCDIVI
jgi:hypothetical protein